jgi:hypothetical protein
MVLTLADTLYFPEVRFNYGDTVKVPIYLRNTHPLHYFVLPLRYGGDLNLIYVDFDTDSCRTDYFGRVRRVASNTTDKYVAFSFSPSYLDYNPPLEPGFGRIINLYFIYNAGTGYNTLDTVTFSGRTLLHDADYIDFQPAVVTGFITDQQLVRGDANGDGIVNILDINFLIAFLYMGGPAPDPYTGDANGDGIINLLDITYLIEYLYFGGPPPPA